MCVCVPAMAQVAPILSLYYIILSCAMVHSLNHSMDWLPVILCTYPSINHYETIDFSQFSVAAHRLLAPIQLTVYRWFFFHNEISDAVIDYDDAADNNIDGKFIFQFHWQQYFFYSCGKMHSFTLH